MALNGRDVFITTCDVRSIIHLTHNWSNLFVKALQHGNTATDKLQRALDATARLVSGTRKFDRGLSRLLHVDLYWLDLPERVQYKLGVTVRRCQQHKSPQYLIVVRQPLPWPVDSDYALPVNFLWRVTDSAHLVVGPSLSLDQWLGIRCQQSADLRDPTCSDESFRRSLKTFLFAKY